jgi:hypothetical protein
MGSAVACPQAGAPPDDRGSNGALTRGRAHGGRRRPDPRLWMGPAAVAPSWRQWVQRRPWRRAHVGELRQSSVDLPPATFPWGGAGRAGAGEGQRR